MFDKLKKLLEGGVAQVNPFDGGKTFQSVVNNRTPQQQNAVQQRQLQARQFNPTRPQQAPQQNFMDKLRDILDANSQADKFRRAQANKPLDYRQEQQQVYGVKRPAMNVGSQLFGNAARFANTAGAAFGEVGDTSAVYGANLADAITGGNQTSQVLAEVNKRQKERYNPQGGIFGAGTWFDNQDDFRKTTADPISLVINKAAPAVVGTVFEAGSMGAGQAVPKLAQVGLKQFLAQGAKAAGARAVEGVIADAASQKFERDRYSPEQSAIAAVAGAGLPIVARGAGKVVGRTIDAAGNAIGRKIVPRSVAEITQEVATARQPAIANNAPRTRVTPDGTTLPPRPASEIAAELAASKARAADPNVQARRAAITGSAPAQPRVNIHPDDQAIIRDLNDYVAGTYQPGTVGARRLETDAAMIAEKYGLPVTRTTEELAEALDSLNARAKNPIFYKKPGDNKSVKQLAPKPSKQNPLEALKAEARKYKSADTFAMNIKDKEVGDNLVVYKGTGGDLDMGGARGFDYLKKVGESQKDMPKNTSSFSQDKFFARQYGDVTPYTVPKKDIMPKEQYSKLIGEVTGVGDNSGTALRGMWRRSDKYPSIIPDVKKAGYKGFTDVNGEIVMFDRSSLTDLYNQATKPPKAYYQNVPKSYTEPKATIQAPAAKPGKTQLELNTKRLNITPEQAAQLDPKVKSVVDRMSNEDVVRVAKSAGLDMKSYSPGETRVKIAEQLNVRQDAVRLMNEAEVARKSGNADQSAELLKQAAEQGRISRTQGTDLARQLQARRIIANELDTPQQKVFKLFDEAGVNPDVYSKRLANVDFSDAKQVVDAFRELVPAKASQWLDTVRYNSMLSSPLTQMVNIFGNAQNVVGVAPIEKTVRGGVDFMASLFGKERQYAAGEGASYLKGEAQALPKAAKAFVSALKGSDEYANPDFSEYNIPLATKGAAGKAYQALSFPMRVLDGMDKFFRTLASAGEEAALDKRIGKGIALKGDKQALIDQEAAYRVFQADSNIPGQGKILDAMDSFANLVMQGRSSNNPIVSTISKFTVPFVKTVNNINKQGFVEYTPAGFLNLIGKEDKVEGLTRAIMGTAVFGTSAMLLKSGDMTWAEPRNAEERARFRAEGKQPYAIKIGGKWYNYSKLTPAVAFPMAMTAALDDAMKEKKLDQSNVDAILESIAKYGNFMSDQSYAKSIGDMLGAVGGDKEAVARMVSNQWQQVVPARAFTGWLARMTDDVERKVDTTAGYFDQQVQSFMQQYPGLRQSTPTRDYKGEPIAANNPVLNAFSPVRVTNDRGVNPLDAEQDAIKAATEQPELLNKRQLKEIDDRTADKVREAQKQLISQPGWSDLTPEEKKSGLSRLESDIKAVEKLQYQAEKQVGQYSGSFTGKSTKLTANQKALINDGVKIGKYVGKSDSTEAKTNKEKYEQALEKFNDPDNGYSRVEKVKKQEELKRLTVQKDYDEDTTMLHGMSKEDVWGFLSTYEDGKAMADKLLALDDALTAAGVQDKNKFRDKYGNVAIKPKEKGSKGGSKAKTVKGQAEAVSSERKLRALLANTNNKASYRKPATQSAKIGLKKFAVKSAGITSRKGV